MDAITMFKEAAKGLQSDSKFLELAAARRANDEDEELQSKIGEFNLLRLDLNNEMEKDGRDENRVAEMNTRINQLYGEIMGNPHMVAYSEAKENMESFLNYVNAILNAAIEGEDPMLVEDPALSSCGAGGCAGCSGCG